MPEKRRIRINRKDIDLIVYDFDGVLTDNRVLVFEDGREAVFCSRADGLVIHKIAKLGLPQIILSTEENGIVEVRAKKLNLEFIQGVKDKLSVLRLYCRKKHYDFKKVVYLGNDINDYEVMKAVGYPIAPNDAALQIKRIARIIIDAKGGFGVVRKLYDMLK